jgi:hypothetical protein
VSIQDGQLGQDFQLGQLGTHIFLCEVKNCLQICRQICFAVLRRSIRVEIAVFKLFVDMGNLFFCLCCRPERVVRVPALPQGNAGIPARRDLFAAYEVMAAFYLIVNMRTQAIFGQ